MKKFMMTMAAALFAVSMNAQTNFYVGGSLGYSTSSNDGYNIDSKLTFLPEFGIKFNDKMGVGVEIGYSGTTESKYTSNTKGEEVELKPTESAFTFAPYFRYTALQVGNFSVFGDAKFAYVAKNDQDTGRDSNGEPVVEDNKVNDWGIYVQPGIAYNLSDKFSLVAKFGNVLGYTSSKQDAPGAKPTTTFEILNLTNKIQFGFFYNF